MCVCYPLFSVIIVICNIMSIIIVFIIMYIYYLTVYMFCISCYGTNKLLVCDFCTFVQINSIQLKKINDKCPIHRSGGHSNQGLAISQDHDDCMDWLLTTSIQQVVY